MLKQSDIIRQLAESQIYRDYEAAFSEATELPLSLRPHELWRHAMDGKKYANPFCVLLAKSSRSCAACLETQEELTQGAKEKTASTFCFAGLCDTAVPLHVGGQVIGFLQTGQVALRKPTRVGFGKVTRQLLEWGSQVDLNRLEDAYFHSKVLKPKQYEGMIRLLEIFAKHLAVSANQIMVQEAHAEPPLVVRARHYIEERAGDPVSLGDIAHALSVSTFHFCKTFRKATGLTFTEYLARTRVEKARNLLLNPNLRVSEIAFECGFGSLGHFNRTFKKVVGSSPTEYREGLHARASLKAVK
jgi:AraC-like DNA-binding protein/ligand-binding sensor protein